ncbi:putative YigZ family protein [Mesonia hippocampi]|uniref:Putative YigZ family protein n=1 Tax=Mesonia hippocampi TaxID=1628250 RepID=A0A840EPB9_9FLAO|nr:YigZ family protein [Mesonia hippocampi]MBB4119988.1 putative YigZ family protein [Mesonia hippocampi]
MSTQKDTYKTLKEPGEETLFKEKGSKFFGYAFPVSTEDEIKTILENIKAQHHQARHWCYAWQLGSRYENHRANDDGEPSNTAGMPIYGQLQSFELTNTLIIVVRYFGGTKLGVGGLITAYKTSAKLAIEASNIVEKTIDEVFKIKFDYPLMNKVMRIVKDNEAQILKQDMTLNCIFTISIREKNAKKLKQIFKDFYGVELLKKNV